MKPDSRKSQIQRIRDWLYGYDIFISYSHRDAEPYAKALAAALRERGFECFWDDDEMPKGSDWQEVAETALVGASRMIVLISPGALLSKSVLHEVEVFTKRGKQPIPIDFGATLDAARNTESQLVNYLGRNVVAMSEPIESLSGTPSTAAVDSLIGTFKILRKRKRRSAWLATLFLIIAAALVFAAWQYRTSEEARRQELRRSRFEHTVTHTLEPYFKGVGGVVTRSPSYDSIVVTFGNGAVVFVRVGKGQAYIGDPFETWRHNSRAGGAAYKPDGSRFLTWGDDKAVAITEISADNHRTVVFTNNEPVATALFQLDGDVVVIANTKDVSLVRASDGSLIGRAKLPANTLSVEPNTGGSLTLSFENGSVGQFSIRR